MAAIVTLHGGSGASASGHLWSDDPATYPRINIAQIGDLRLTYKIDLSGLLFSPNHRYSPNEVLQLEESVERAFAMWNDVLSPLGLQFERRDRHEVVEIPVIALNYEPVLPDEFFGDSIAGAVSVPIQGVMTLLPIAFDNTEPLGDLSLVEETIFDRTLQQPYVRFVDSPLLDVCSVALHEIGHMLGLAHPADAFPRKGNYNFLALPSVSVDPACMTPSEYVGGERVERRRPLLRTEIKSVMTPIREGGAFLEIPPEDIAFVAFNFRHLNPAGADEVLRRAQARLAETNPYRFANVIEEFEKDGQGHTNNDDLSRAMKLDLISVEGGEPGIIVLGSCGVTAADATVQDVDYYEIHVRNDQADLTWFIDVDAGGGLAGISWIDSTIDIVDVTGEAVLIADDSLEIDEGSISEVDPFIEWVPEVGGTYFIFIRSAIELPEEGSTGDYALKIGVGHVPEPAGEKGPIDDPSVAACKKVDPLPAREMTACGVLSGLPIFLSVGGMWWLRGNGFRNRSRRCFRRRRPWGGRGGPRRRRR